MIWLLTLLLACENTVGDETDTGGGGDDSDTEDSDTEDTDTDTEDSDTEDTDTEDTDTEDTDTEDTGPVDADGDTYAADVDCDDANADVYPGAVEICNGIDDDCSDGIDDDASDATTFFLDSDADGYGDASAETLACNAPADHVSQDGDCDDSNADVNPDADEVCDTVDNDCSGSADDDAIDGSLFYPDDDGDSYGNNATGLSACAAPSGYVADNTDCDDTNSAINPLAEERCNTTDDDCDNEVDEEAADAQFFFEDLDEDGHGNSDAPVEACSKGAKMSGTGGDCDDTDPDVNPNGIEQCNGKDDNCDNTPDNPLDAPFWYADADGDGAHGGDGIQACDQPSGTSASDPDCNDTDPLVFPGSLEVPCDGVDQDCNGVDFPEVSDDNGVFVAAGQGRGPGLKSDPMGTVEAAVIAAEADGKRWIFIHSASGFVNETITTSVSLLGGFSENFSEDEDSYCTPGPVSTVVQPVSSLDTAITLDNGGGHLVIGGINAFSDQSYDAAGVSRLSLIYGNLSGARGNELSNLDLYVHGTRFEGLEKSALRLDNVTATMWRPLIACYGSSPGIVGIDARDSTLNITRARFQQNRAEGCVGIRQGGGAGDLTVTDSEIEAVVGIDWGDGHVELRNNVFYAEARSNQNNGGPLALRLHTMATGRSIGNHYVIDAPPDTSVNGILVQSGTSLLMGHDVVEITRGGPGQALEVSGELTVVNSAVAFTDFDGTGRAGVYLSNGGMASLINSVVIDVNGSARPFQRGLWIEAGSQASLYNSVFSSIWEPIWSNGSAATDTDAVMGCSWDGCIDTDEVVVDDSFSLSYDTFSWTPYSPALTFDLGRDPTPELGDDAALSYCGQDWSNPCTMPANRPANDGWDIGPVETPM